MKQATLDRILGDEPTLTQCRADGCRFEAVTMMHGECGCRVALCRGHRDQWQDRQRGVCVACGAPRSVNMFAPIWAGVAA